MNAPVALFETLHWCWKHGLIVHKHLRQDVRCPGLDSASQKAYSLL